MNSFQPNLYFERTFDKGRLKKFVRWFLNKWGIKKTIYLLDTLKFLGFKYARLAGISLNLEDLYVPSNKDGLVKVNQFQLLEQEFQVFLKNNEQNAYSLKFINTWTLINELLRDSFLQYFRKRKKNYNTVVPQNIMNMTRSSSDKNNRSSSKIIAPKKQSVSTQKKKEIKSSGSDSLYIMAFSGARGNMSQVSQLTLMRGLMSDPLGNLVEFPIISNFKEGLNLTEYLISCYGARKGIIDTGLRTATAGDFTRRLVDVAHSVLIKSFECGTQNGIYLNDLILRKSSAGANKKNLFSLKQRLLGRVIANNSRIPANYRNKEISHDFLKPFEWSSDEIAVRSPLTCEALPTPYLCRKCYGWNARGRMIDLGEAVGVLAAQSLGEPGTQLTLRTFHTGGIYSEKLGDFKLIAPFDGNLIIPNSCTIKNYFNNKVPQGEIISTFITNRLINDNKTRQFNGIFYDKKGSFGAIKRFFPLFPKKKKIFSFLRFFILSSAYEEKMQTALPFFPFFALAFSLPAHNNDKDPSGKDELIQKKEERRREEGVGEKNKIILKYSLVKILQKIVNNVQSVYRAQGVEIYDQHVEVLVSRVGSKIRVKEKFHSTFFWNEVVPLNLIRTPSGRNNTEIEYEPVLTGITKVSLQSDSFLSAASFQNTSKILSRASLKKSKDFLFGLKENIIVNKLIPSGTGILFSF
uniref:RNA polymerase beta'' subunit n=1 Tax=Cephaleuros virescens TaxID=173371 RepID=UPI001EDE3570|nr:RNA polymerase beta'' subunit [Cephaleuros virescens]UIB38659.1 RNA polymerase beta'' subunit [Cephaleuros virescens]